MKPANFPERRRQRIIRAMERQGKIVPEYLKMDQRGKKTKVKRTDHRKKEEND